MRRMGVERFCLPPPKPIPYVRDRTDVASIALKELMTSGFGLICGELGHRTYDQ